MLPILLVMLILGLILIIEHFLILFIQQLLMELLNFVFIPFIQQLELVLKQLVLVIQQLILVIQQLVLAIQQLVLVIQQLVLVIQQLVHVIPQQLLAIRKLVFILGQLESIRYLVLLKLIQRLSFRFSINFHHYDQ